MTRLPGQRGMGMRLNTRRKALLCLTAFILLSVVFTVCFAFLRGQQSRNDSPAVDFSADYIVRLREKSDTGAPFEVIRGDVLADMLEGGGILWYEKDEEIPLLDAGIGTESEEPGSESCYFESYQWNLAVIGAEAAFDRNAAGQGIRVGVIDSGVNPHPDLGSRLLPGCNYIENAKNPDDTSDTFGHGTRVAGLIAGAGKHGCIGAAPMAEIVPLKCTDGQTVRVSALCRAIYGGIDDFSCRVLNMSMGLQTDHQALAEAAAYAEEKNVVLTAGAGNGGGKQLFYPAAYETVIGVGAVDRSGNWYDRSNHSACVFLTAPGVDVRTTDHRGGYSAPTGCSYAVPQVSAAAADLLSIDGSLTPKEIMDLLCQGAADAGSEGWDEYYGHGILNLAGCVEKAAGPRVNDGPACEFLPDAGGAASAVRNLTDRTLVCEYLLAEYTESGACVKVTSVRVTVPPYGTSEIPVPPGKGRWTQTLVDPDSGIPLVPARQMP